MRWYDSVRFNPDVAMALAAFRVDEIYKKFGYEMWITSGKDKTHNPGSLHPLGRAFDIKTMHVPRTEWQAIHAAIVACLGPAFDVVLEADHIHLEYDPKN